ncbi:hypothetical protein ABB37_01957 [Leptomonas pyrrhocoris]|uniref:protein-serine/threonine phosphatase n=1 Tax=Leptomonas pyrrhocoris TaxID=157538 RepID=A0A0M9G6X0_LEPPY|nr:hypothetical protein ABB37_01957 [Leptomonas pyrrhocoris]KPA83703.1 hypothetical protein ABB37_01957 [Leptomonas pyrrhocoris]|eukprot:XP_015662142.1 hypothetical protein ABB37_01957 [Leptomonas pyrrhocoris]
MKDAAFYRDKEQSIIVDTAISSSDATSHTSGEGRGKRRRRSGPAELRRTAEATQVLEDRNEPLPKPLTAPSSNAPTPHHTSEATPSPLRSASSATVPSTFTASTDDASRCRGASGTTAPPAVRRGGPWLAVVHGSPAATSVVSRCTHASSAASGSIATEFLSAAAAAGAGVHTRSFGTARSRIPTTAAAASRVLFLHDADADGDGWAEKSMRVGEGIGGDAACLHSSHGARDGGSVSGRSPIRTSSGTAVPAAMGTESNLLELLACASSADVAGVSADEASEAGRTEVAEPNSWLRAASNYNNTPYRESSVSTVSVAQDTAEVLRSAGGEEGGDRTRSAVRGLSRPPSPTRRAAPSASVFVFHPQNKEDSATELDAPILLDALKEKDGAAQTPPPPPRQHDCNALSSSGEVVRLSLPAMALNLSPADSSGGCHGGRRRAISPSVPRNLFSDAHTCAAELPESDMFCIATTNVDGNVGSEFDASASISPAEGLDMSSFRTPLSPCPSSVAPPFAVFPCAATSRVTSPVSIPAKMMKQRQRGHAWARKGSPSPASQMPSPGGGLCPGSGSNYSNHHPHHPHHHHQCNNTYHSASSAEPFNSSLRGLRELFGSLAMASLTTCPLPSTFASALDSASHEAVEGDSVLGRSDPRVAAVEWKQRDRSSTCPLMASTDGVPKQQEEEAEQEVEEEVEEGEGPGVFDHSRRRGTCAPLHHGELLAEGGASSCLYARPAAAASLPVTALLAPPEPTTAASSITTTTAINASTSAAQPALYTAPVPAHSRLTAYGTCTPPRDSSRSASQAAPFPPVSPLVDRSRGYAPLHISTSPSELSSRTATTLRSCCASPWSPTSAKANLMTEANDTAAGEGVNSGWGSCADGDTPTRGARRCSPPLPATPANESAWDFPLTSQRHDSGARTPTLGQPPPPQQQQQRSRESSNLMSLRGSGDASLRSGRPASASPVFTASARAERGSFHCPELRNSSSECARLGGGRSCVSLDAAAAIGAVTPGTPTFHPSSQPTHPRLTLYSSVACAPLVFSSQPAQPRTPTPGRISTCSTPPPTPLLPARTSPCVSPCELTPAVYHHHQRHADSYAGSMAFADPTDRRDVASQGTTSPLHDPANTFCNPVHRTDTTTVAAPAVASADLIPRKSRCVLPPHRSVRPSLSPSPFPPTSSYSFVEVPAAAAEADGHAAPLCSLVSLPSPTTANPNGTAAAAAAASADVVGGVCDGVESELCGLQSSSTSGSAPQLPPDLSGGSSPTYAFKGPRSAGGPTDSIRGFNSPVERAGGIDGRAPSHEQRSFGVHQTFTDAQEKRAAAAVGNDPNIEEMQDTAVPLTHGRHRQTIDGDRCSSAAHIADGDNAREDKDFHNNIHDDVLGSPSRFSSLLQLVPPPPLVTLPRSSSLAASLTSSTFSLMASSSAVGRSRRPSPVFGGDGEGVAVAASFPPPIEGDEPPPSPRQTWRGAALSARPLDDAAAPSAGVGGVREMRLPASSFHYAFSSLRGSRSRQEDSVTLAPDLLVRGGATCEGCDGGVVEQASRREGRGTESGPSLVDLSKPEAAHTRCCVPLDLHTEPIAFTCFGVFDGHCGDTISSLASQYFPEHFEFAVKEYWAQWSEEKRRVAALRLPPEALKTAAATLPSLSPSANTEGAGAMGHAATDVSEASAAAASAGFQRVISAALVQSLVHLDLTLYDAVHRKTSGRASTQRRDAGSTASVVAFYKVPPFASVSRDGCPRDSCAGAPRTTTQLQRERGETAKDNRSSRNNSGRSSPTVRREEEVDAAAMDTYRLCIANLGDSRAIIGNKHTHQLLLSTTDHRISSCPAEEVRIEAVGGVVDLGRVDGSLDVTRGLGDYRYKVDPTQWWAAAASAPPSAKKPRAVGRQTPALGTKASISTTQSSTAPSSSSNTMTAASTPSPSPLSTSTGGDTPGAEVTTAARALQWQSASTTPVPDSRKDDDEPNDAREDTRGAPATAAVDGDDNSGDIRPTLNAEGEREGEGVGAPRGTNVEEGQASDQWGRSILNGPPSSIAAASAEKAAAHLPRERSTDRELFVINAAAAAPATSALISFPSHQTLHDRPSPPPPTSPSRPAAVLTGNAVSNIADVYEWEVHRDDVLIIASDGVWDSMTSEEVLNFVCNELKELESESEAPHERPKAATASSPVVTSGDGVSFAELARTTGVDTKASDLAQPPTSSLSSSFTLSTKATRERAATADGASQLCGTPTPAPLDDLLHSTPLRRPITAYPAQAFRTPCGDDGGSCFPETTPDAVDCGSASRSSAVQTAARRLTEYVVNTLSGNDNTTAIVVVFR